MAYQGTLIHEETVEAVGKPPRSRTGPVEQAFWLLYAAYIVAPIVAGLDKYFDYLTDWGNYLSPTFANIAGGNIPGVMHVVGIVEIIAGLLVAIKPRIGGVVVAAWLAGIIVNLLLIPGYFDIVLRDFGLLLGSLALSRLSSNLGLD